VRKFQLAAHLRERRPASRKDWVTTLSPARRDYARAHLDQEVAPGRSRWGTRLARIGPPEPRAALEASFCGIERLKRLDSRLN
jgi:hypothetical protein